MFSMNQEVTVTGMKVQTRVGDNLQISADNVEANFRNGLDQERSAFLEPVSTTDALTFSWHATDKNVNGNGSVSDTTFTEYNEDTTLSNTDAGKSNYDNEFIAAHGFSGIISTTNVAYGYIDYSFYLKAINSTEATQKLAMTVCNLTYQGAALGADKAWRVAVFAYNTAKETTIDDATVVTDGNRKTMLGVASCAYFDSKAVDEDQALAAAPTLGTAAMIDDAVAKQATSYYKVVVRLWLEGQDTTCNNDTFAALTGDFRLDLRFVLGENPTGASVIGSAQAAAATSSGLTGTVSLTSGAIANGEVAVSYQWYNAETNAPIAGQTAQTYTAASTAKVYCLVTTARGSVYRTNTISL